MTCIAALQYDGRVWMGADSALSVDGALTVAGRPKVWVRGCLVLGHAGSLRVGNVLEALTLPAYEGGSRFQYMVEQLVPAMADALEAAGATFEEQDLLVGVDGTLFCVDSELGVHDYVDGYGAIGDGNGAQAALGVLHYSHRDPPEMRLKGALSAAEAFCTTVRRPWSLVRC